MLTERQTAITFGCAVIGLVVGALTLAWPRYRQANTINDTIESVRHRVLNEESERQSLALLADQLDAAQERFGDDLKTIPTHTDMASLMTALAVDVDNVTVVDQTLSTGRVNPVTTVEDGSLYARPLTIYMIGSFEVAYGLIRTAEEMDNLVRVVSVTLKRKADQPDLVDATIVLHAVFDVGAKAAAGGA